MTVGTYLPSDIPARRGLEKPTLLSIPDNLFYDLKQIKR